MLARKAEYIQGSGESRVISVETFRSMHHRFRKTIWRTIVLGMMISIFLASGVFIQAVQTDRGYTLMQEKERVQQLQRENDNLRVDIAKLESPERIYTMATKQLGMVMPAHVLYAPSSNQHAATKSR